MEFFTGNALWELVQASDTISKLTLLVLLIMSILCWSVAIYKFIMLSTHHNLTKKARTIIAHVSSLQNLYLIEPQLRGTLPGSLLSEIVLVHNALLQNGAGFLTEKDYIILDGAAEHAFIDTMHHQEEYLSVLSTCAAAAPLIGLFGTVWGLIHAFMRISQKQSADIATVAPGIAEALITTLAGLLVAIPALFLFHILQSKLRSLEHDATMIVDRSLWIIKRGL